MKANKGSVVLPPRFSLSVNQNYKEFKERSTDSALASSTVSIQLRPSGGEITQRLHRRLVFVSYLRLNQILGSALDPSNSVISLNVVPKLDNIGHQEPIVILQLPMEPSAMEVECFSWPRVKAEGNACSVAKWHNGSRECVCNGFSSYALNVTGVNDVMMDLREELTSVDEAGGLFETSKVEAGLTTTMVVIVAVSATLLVASVLSAALLVIYCRRVKVKSINFV